MITKKILVGSIDNVKTLCNAATAQEFEIDLGSGRYIIDAKSIMGIFSLDLSKAIELRIHTDEDSAKSFIDTISFMLV